MPDTDEVIQLFKRLAEEHQKRDQMQARDRFLLLAADAAHAAGRPDEAERLRRTILGHNPNHLLKPYANFAEALKAPDIQAYVTQLRQNYSFENAERLLLSLREEEQPDGKIYAFEEELSLPMDPDVVPADPLPKPVVRPSAPSPPPVTERPIVRPRPAPAVDAAKQPPVWTPQVPPGVDPRVRNNESRPPDRERSVELSGTQAFDETGEYPPGAWVGWLVFVLVLLGSLALLALVFVRPLLR